MNTFINDYIQDWLAQNPTASNLILIIAWMVNHPLFSILIFILSLVIIWKIVKGLDKLLEITGLSVLKVVFNFIWRGVKSILIAVTKLTGWSWEKLSVKNNQLTNELPLPLTENTEPVPVKIDKEQRLQEIQNRLTALNQEQNELLQEASQLLSSSNQNLPQNEITV